MSYTVTVPANVAIYGVITGDDLLDVFQFGKAHGPLIAGVHHAVAADRSIYLYGHVDDAQAARFAEGLLVEDGDFQRVWALFTRRSIEGTVEPTARWWAAPVEETTANAVPITILRARTGLRPTRPPRRSEP